MSKLLKPAIIALAALFAASAQAGPLKRDPAGDILTLQNGATVRLPVCHDSKGEKVRFSVADHVFTDMRGPTSAWDAYSMYSVNGSQTILQTSLLTKEPDTVTYLAEHECDHHRRGHIREAYLAERTGQPLSKPVHALELEADCGAAQSLQKQGWDEARLRKFFASVPHTEGTTTHPGTDERLQMALSCLVPQ